MTKGGGDLDRMVERPIEREGTLLEPLSQRFALQVFHYEEIDPIRAPNIVQSADVLMAEARDGPCFALEPLPQLCVLREMLAQNLDRYSAIQARVSGLVYLAHAAFAEKDEDFVRSQASSGGERHMDLSDFTSPNRLMVHCA
jgi:hypothetical protein